MKFTVLCIAIGLRLYCDWIFMYRAVQCYLSIEGAFMIVNWVHRIIWNLLAVDSIHPIEKFPAKSCNTFLRKSWVNYLWHAVLRMVCECGLVWRCVHSHLSFIELKKNCVCMDVMVFGHGFAMEKIENLKVEFNLYHHIHNVQRLHI